MRKSKTMPSISHQHRLVGYSLRLVNEINRSADGTASPFCQPLFRRMTSVDGRVKCQRMNSRTREIPQAKSPRNGDKWMCARQPPTCARITCALYPKTCNRARWPFRQRPRQRPRHVCGRPKVNTRKIRRGSRMCGLLSSLNLHVSVSNVSQKTERCGNDVRHTPNICM